MSEENKNEVLVVADEAHGQGWMSDEYLARLGANAIVIGAPTEPAMPNRKTYVALYMPSRREGEEDPSREFPTEEEAWQFVFDGMCGDCKEERERALAGSGDEMDSTHPACSCEWFVVPKDELDEAETIDDIMTAAGYDRVIYRREDDE